MTTLTQHHLSLGANLAPDNIPLDYGDLRSEFVSAMQACILLDRSHEGRILLRGRDRLNLVQRMSTNDVATLAENEGCATVFTNANARILYRAVCYNGPDGLLLISEAGQGTVLAGFLRRNIFFGDQVMVEDISESTAQFAIHGPGASAVAASLSTPVADSPTLCSVNTEVSGSQVTLLRRKSLVGEHWNVVCATERASEIHHLLLQRGADRGLMPAGSLTYNALRIRSSRPAGLELSSDYIPLEVGLWDEVSFSKGCYTGQEIIARLESRGRLAKTMVRLDMPHMVAAPAKITVAGKAIGTLTSSASAANGEIYALAVIRLSHALPGQKISVGEHRSPAEVKGFAGVQPPYLVHLLQEN
ncbi:MAG: folate-binding protein YgfZ [Chloroflexi bacterium]|nr:folate-binding protein YgfZ [Chloroflexota bacterium]